MPSSSENVDYVIDGCPQYEVLLVLITAPIAILLRNLALPWIFLGRSFPKSGSGLGLKFLLDFVICVMPVVLCTTVFANTYLFRVILVLCIVTLLLFVVGEFYMLGKARPPFKGVWHKIIEEHHHPTTFVTYLRAMVLVFTGVSILAVDFRIYPRRLAKTGHFGHSLMDVGVAAFVYITALAPHVKTAKMRERGQARASSRFPLLSYFYSSTAILLYLGVGRTVILKLLDYHEAVSEYGVHWNFFYTFFLIKVISRILPRNYHVVLGVLFSVIQQALLSAGVQNYIISDTQPRDNIFSANREGICSVLGYVAIYYLASSVGKFITNTGWPKRRQVSQNPRRHRILLSIVGKDEVVHHSSSSTSSLKARPSMSPDRHRQAEDGRTLRGVTPSRPTCNTSLCCRIRNWINCALQLFALGVAFFLLQKASEMGFGPPSRRVVNLSYILSQMALLTVCLSFCLFVQLVSLVGWAANVPHFGTEENPWAGVQPCLLDAVNRTGIAFFLLNNVLTGLVNMSFDTDSASDTLSVSILSLYMFVCCAAASFAVARHRNMRGGTQRLPEA